MIPNTFLYSCYHVVCSAEYNLFGPLYNYRTNGHEPNTLDFDVVDNYEIGFSLSRKIGIERFVFVGQAHLHPPPIIFS